MGIFWVFYVRLLYEYSFRFDGVAQSLLVCSKEQPFESITFLEFFFFLGALAYACSFSRQIYCVNSTYMCLCLACLFDFQKLSCDTSPSEILSKLLGEDAWDIIAVQTNLYAQQQGAPSSYKPATADDIKALLGVLVLQSVFVYNEVTDYWSAEFGLDAVRGVFTRDRFLELMRYFHLVNNDNKDPTDPFWKLRWLLDRMDRSRRFLAAGRYLTVDERLIPFKVRHHASFPGLCFFCNSFVFVYMCLCTQGRVLMKVYMPSKPAKFGLKVVLLLSFVHSFD